MSHLGRLPPLQAIGRSQCVDMEDPPDISDTEIDRLVDEYYNKEKVYIYDPEHASTALAGLASHFRVLMPGGHLCKRIPEMASGFTHSQHSVAFSVKYAELRHMLQTQSHLQFVRDYTSRLNAASMFVRDLEAVVHEEYQMWYDICHDRLGSVPTTKLEYLSAICEDLRVHMNHWNSVKQLLYTDPRLRSEMPSLVVEAEKIRVCLFELRDKALWWVDRLIQVGFRVLAHCDLERISSDALWGITRGLEEFNSIVSAVKYDSVPEMKSKQSNVQTPGFVKFNSYRSIGESIKPVPFARVLNMLASERSRYAAATTHQFFSNCRDLLHLALSRKGLGTHNWGEGIINKSTLKSTNTSDYHTASGSHVSLGTVMLRVGGVSAPDLSREASPLMDFARREKTFAHKFLQIVCHSTKLLKRHPGQGVGFKKGATPPINSNSTTNTPNLPPRGSRRKDRIRLDPEGPEISQRSVQSSPLAPRSDSKRKSVSWSDASEMTMIQQLIQRYMDMLWQYFGTSVTDQFTQPVWGSPEEVKGQLGSLVVCSDLIIQVIVRMITHSCAKDIFPSGAADALVAMSEHVTMVAAWRAWDVAFCSALASSSTDKCHPVLLEAGEHSTVTAKWLRDAFQPLHAALCLLQNTANGGSSGKTTSMALAVATVQRLVIVSAASIRWSNTRGALYLNSWGLGAFLLVSQSDFKILGDELRRGVANCQCLCDTESHDKEGAGGKKSQSTESRNQQLNDLKEEVEALSGQLQALSGSLVRLFSEKCHKLAMEYFDEEMPTGKIWKKRQALEPNPDPSPYVAHALDSLLEPIIAGANKLATTSQLSVVSMATTAMCEAWTEVILQRKIKFSVAGAHQLEQDFQLVQTWLETYVSSPQVKQSVLDLDIFKYLSAIVDLLKRQPRGRSASRPPERRKMEQSSSGTSSAKPSRKLMGLQINVGEGKAQRQRAYEATSSSCNVSVATGSDPWQDASTTVAPHGVVSYSDDDHDRLAQQTANQNGESRSGIADDPANFKVPKIEQWLALRVHGGARNWPKLPSCFNNTNS